MTNGMNKECMLEDFLTIKRTHEAYQVESEEDTFTCMNYQVNTNTIEDFMHSAMAEAKLWYTTNTLITQQHNNSTRTTQPTCAYL